MNFEFYLDGWNYMDGIYMESSRWNHMVVVKNYILSFICVCSTILYCINVAEIIHIVPTRCVVLIFTRAFLFFLSAVITFIAFHWKTQTDISTQICLCKSMFFVSVIQGGSLIYIQTTISPLAYYIWQGAFIAANILLTIIWRCLGFL